MNKKIGIVIVLAMSLGLSIVIINILTTPNVFEEEVAYYKELADSELWCSLTYQPEEYTWEFHKSYYDIVISKWEKVTRKELRTKVMEYHNLKYEEYTNNIVIVRIVEADLVIFFFHAIPDSSCGGVTYWKSG